MTLLNDLCWVAALNAYSLVPWFVLVGSVLVAMAVASRLVQRLPLSPAMLYLAIGFAVSPAGANLLPVNPLAQAKLLEALTEIGVLISLFAVGLRLQLHGNSWRTAATLASFSMMATAALTAAAAVWLLDMPLGMAVLLGAILAPTDPVLASEVQTRHADDRDPVRVSITGEGALNDGTAFPLVMLGLGLMGWHLAPHSGMEFALRWALVDLLWAVLGGLLLGWICGQMMGWLLRQLRQIGLALEFEEFLVIGLIALTYGLALALKAYGFLAVFAAGVALAQWFEKPSGKNAPAVQAAALAPAAAAKSDTSPLAYQRVSSFAGQLERLLEVAVVITLGAMLAWIPAAVQSLQWQQIVFAVLMIVVLRPLAVFLTVPNRWIPLRERGLIAWFGVRGVGSMYYLSFALNHGLGEPWAMTTVSVVLLTITASILLHGISGAPLMQWYEGKR